MSAGKTIGRVKPEADRSKVNETIAATEEVHADAAHEERLAPRERVFSRDNFDLKRQLDVERARVAVLIGNNGKATDAPIGTSFERVAEFERRILAMGDMTDEARLREVRALFDDVTNFTKAKAKWLAEVEAQVALRVAPEVTHGLVDQAELRRRELLKQPWIAKP